MTDSDIGQEIFDFRSCLFGKMSGNSAKRLINWHTGWLGEKDAKGDLVGDWAQYSDKEQFKCQYCDVERKYSNGGRTSLIQHSESQEERRWEKTLFVKCRGFFLLKVKVIFKILFLKF